MLNKTSSIMVIVLLLITGSALYFGAPEEILRIGDKLPEILYINDCKNTLEIKLNHRPLILVYFSSSCSHCNYEINLFKENYKLFMDVDLYMLTSETDYFNTKHYFDLGKLAENDNVKFGVITLNTADKKLGADKKPSLLFFNKEGILKGKTKGETKLKKLLELKKESEAPELQIGG